MTGLIALVAIALCAAGAFAGLIGVVSLAIRREETNLTLTGEATGTAVRVARRLNGVYVRAPRRAAAADRQTALVQPAHPLAGETSVSERLAREARPGWVSPGMS